MCAHAVRVSLKSVNGVDSVDVSLAKGLAIVKMKPGNTATLKQLQQAITKNGFTMKSSKATILGTVLTGDGQPQLKITGSNDVVRLTPGSKSDINLSVMQGKTVLVTGIIPESPRGKSPESLSVESVQEGAMK